METIQEFARFVATLCCGIFAGASIYINLVEHPARMACGTAFAVKEFEPSYRRATVMQASLASVGFVSGVAAWLSGAGIWWLVGGIFLGLVIPVTLILILPVNKQLLSSALERDSIRAQELLFKWNRLHSLRSLLSTIAFVICLLSI